MKHKLLVFLCLFLSACVTQHTDTVRPNQTAAGYNMELGLAYLKQGRMARSKSKLLLALSQAPHWPEVYNAMAYYSEQTGEMKSARRYYKKAIDLNPALGTSQNNYGAFLCRRGHYRKAIEHFNFAVQDPDYLNGSEAFENSGLCALLIPDKKLAKHYFLKAIQHDPARFNAQLELANLNFEEKNYKDAKAHLSQFKLYSAPTPQSLWLNIRLAHALHDEDTAVSDALLLKQRFPNSKKYHCYLAWRDANRYSSRSFFQ